MNYNKAAFLASYGISSQLPGSDRPEISFSGRSNVGKSSLINKLCNRKNLARVSSTPGKTATINFYQVDSCYFVDLPGYGYAKVSNADRQRWDRYLHYHGVPFVVALTKADKLKKSQLEETRAAFEEVCRPFGCRAVVLTSAESGYGIPQLQAILDEAVAGDMAQAEGSDGL